MKKTIKKKLTLSKETIIGLANDQLIEIAGAVSETVCNNCITVQPGCDHL